MVLKNERIAITVSSDLGHEFLVAEIMIDSVFIGLVTNEPNQGLCFEIPENQLFWQTVELSIFEKALKLAKDELIAPV